MDVRHSQQCVFVRIDIPEIVMLFPCILFWCPIVLKPKKPPTTTKNWTSNWWLQPTFQKKKRFWLHLGSSLDHLGSPPVSGPYTAAIGTMCYQFQSDTPGDFETAYPPRYESTRVGQQKWTQGLLGYLYHINCWLFQLCCPSKVASKRKKGWGSRIQKMLKSSYLFRGGKCWYLSPATRKKSVG